MKRAVALLGEKEVQSIMRQEGKIEVSWTPPLGKSSAKACKPI